MLHNKNLIYLLISNQHFCSFFFSFFPPITTLHVSEIPHWCDLTNCAVWHTSSNSEQGNEGKQFLRKTRASSLNSFCGFTLRFAVSHSLLVPMSFFPFVLCLSLFSVTCNSPSFLSLPVAFSLLILFSPPLKKEHSCSPRWRVSSIHTSVFHLVLHCSRENTDTKHQYLDSSSVRQGSSRASLHELAREAVMSKPETSQGQNRTRWLSQF